MSTLKDIITCAVNSLEAGVENKAETINSIQRYVEDNFIDKKAIEQLPMETFIFLNEKYGVVVELQAGKLKGLAIAEDISCKEYPGLRPLRIDIDKAI